MTLITFVVVVVAVASVVNDVATQVQDVKRNAYIKHTYRNLFNDLIEEAKERKTFLKKFCNRESVFSMPVRLKLLKGCAHFLFKERRSFLNHLNNSTFSFLTHNCFRLVFLPVKNIVLWLINIQKQKQQTIIIF